AINQPGAAAEIHSAIVESRSCLDARRRLELPDRGARLCIEAVHGPVLASDVHAAVVHYGVAENPIACLKRPSDLACFCVDGNQPHLIENRLVNRFAITPWYPRARLDFAESSSFANLAASYIRGVAQ